MRQANPIPLTLEEHRELGREIRTVSARLHELCELVVTVYGPQNQAAYTFLQVTDSLGRLRKDLEAQAGQDLPEVPLDGTYL